VFCFTLEREETSPVNPIFELAPESKAAVRQQAVPRGMTVAQCLVRLAGQLIPCTFSARVQKANPKGKERQVRQFASAILFKTPAVVI
jgi:hypothetical protein